ncbi:MAG: sulfite exporter TauE/SafE family protein [Alphaproteobacteria bacterium]|nr:sulfite exporter TauE/SafE family protein [Alphaproteobacteria bacterium]
MELTAATIAIAVIALVIGGFAKGLLGVGLPMVATPILSTFAPIPDVVAIMYFSVIITNLYQAVAGGLFIDTLKRFWPMALVMLVSVPVGTYSLMRLSPGTIAVLLGLAIAVFALASLINPTLRIPPRAERPTSICAGAVGGYFGGMALIGGPPVIMMMVAMHLKKEEFIGAIGMVYMCMLVPAGFSLVGLGVLRTEHIVPGLLALIPVGAALIGGQWLRGRIDQQRFRKVLLIAMVLMGLNLIRRGIF